MNDITTVLNKNSFRVKELLRRYNIVGQPNMSNIQTGFNRYGEPFMMKLLEIITPDESSFTELIQPRTGLLASSVQTTSLMPMKSASPEVAEGGKAWTFWEKLLGAVDATGKTLGQFKNDVAKSPTTSDASPEELAKQDNTKKTLYLIAGGFAVLIILILIFRK